VSTTPEARIRGIEHPLPPGERVRWQGAPNLKLLALHVLHVRAVAAYFLVIIGIWALRYAGELPREQFTNMLIGQLALGAVVVLGGVGYAWALAKSSIYAITDRRVVIKTGIAFPMTINIPLRVIASAGLRSYRDGSGEVALALDGSDRVAYLALWPHARPWRLKVPEPAFRGLPDPAAVGEELRTAVADFAAREGLAMPATGAAAEGAAGALAQDPAVVA
jgi:hypothetical protein